jgi:hypothetical protein
LLAGLSARRDTDFFCLNDGSEQQGDESYRAATVLNFLAGYFPYPAPWELDTTGHPGQLQDVSSFAA